MHHWLIFVYSSSTHIAEEEQERVLQEVEQAWLRAQAQGKSTTGLGAPV